MGSAPPDCGQVGETPADLATSEVTSCTVRGPPPVGLAHFIMLGEEGVAWLPELITKERWTNISRFEGVRERPAPRLKVRQRKLTGGAPAGTYRVPVL